MAKTCFVTDCTSDAHSRQMCLKHYWRWRRTGDPLGLKAGAVRTDPMLRFAQHIDFTMYCWEWTASKQTKGHGQFDGTLAHRFAYREFNGEIPEGLVVDHRCHNPGCVNPMHLRLLTIKQNGENRRGAQRNSTSGVRGVHWNSKNQKWIAQVKHNGTQYYGGMFDNIPEAEAAAINLRNQLFTHNDLDRATA